MLVEPTLTVDLGAIVKNWQLLKGRFTGRECGAVVKADAYGLGANAVSQALEKAGCHTFFVATLPEALALRETLPDVRIVVFHGVGEGEEFSFINHRIIPVLASREQIRRWMTVAAQHVHAASILHIDTGMARLGLQPDDFFALLEQQPTLAEDVRASAVMSHLACAGEPSHASNALQLSIMQRVRAALPTIPMSLCNSGGIFLANDFHFDLARPGCSLYGIAPQDHAPNPMHQVASWLAPVLQIRTLTADQAVGYGATQLLPAGSKIATVASGYADGYLRMLTGTAVAYVGDHQVPLIGRVTMDMLSFDVSNVPEATLNAVTHIELLGDKNGIRVDEVAAEAGTIGYEVFTRIGARVRRIYL